MEQEPTYVGIDVAKAQVDVALRPTGERWVVSYQEPGIRELVSQLKTIGPANQNPPPNLVGVAFVVLQDVFVVDSASHMLRLGRREGFGRRF